jgi:hypothetical protein
MRKTDHKLGDIKASDPKLISIPKAQQRMADIGKTLIYKLINIHGLTIVKIAGRSALLTSEVDALIEKVTAEAQAKKTGEQCKAA